HVEDFHGDQGVRVKVGAEVAVDQLEAAVGQLVGEQAAGEADVVEDGFQGLALLDGMAAPVVLMRHQVAGADLAVLLDAVASRFSHIILLSVSTPRLSFRARCLNQARRAVKRISNSGWNNSSGTSKMPR